ncbi:MAG: DUF2334 domain-containing protein [Opitutaceae bacterium]
MCRPSSGTSARAELDRRLVVSFHDLHPGSREICARFVERLARLGVPRISLLAVPRWHGGKPLSDDLACVRWMNSAVETGHEICLHGFFHRADACVGGPLSRLIARHYTAGEGEFFQISKETACDRLNRGLSILDAAGGLPVVGFTPPAWLMSEAGREAAKACGLRYTTTFSEVEFLQHGGQVAAPTVVYSCRNSWRRLVSRGWVRVWARVQQSAPVLRIAAHPGDFLDPHVERSLYNRIAEALRTGRRPVTYRELLPGETRPAAFDPLSAA